VTIEPCGVPTNATLTGVQWNFTNGTVRAFRNKCLDVTNGKDANGVQLQIWTCFKGNTNQQWYYTGDHRYITCIF
jgi:hypothetical protein